VRERLYRVRSAAPVIGAQRAGRPRAQAPPSPRPDRKGPPRQALESH
jgi:hypothetical protein